MTVKVGWLQQNLNTKGGAEMSCSALVDNAPDWADVVYCPPNKRPPRDVDVFVVQNSTVYGARWIEELALKPVIRHVRDPWFAGSAQLRRWLLDNAKALIFSSQTQLDELRSRYPLHQKPNAWRHIIPVPVILEPFKAAAKPKDEREGTVFVGRCDVYKGAPWVIDWSIRTGEPLTMIGNNQYMDFGKLPPWIKFMGQVPYSQMPDILGSAKTYIARPFWVEAFGRSVVEAWAAGCELSVDGDVGAMWWIENEPERLGFQGPIDEFWAIVEETIK
jgi:glycosyltransferase involved in cell wall biosynthesis